MVLFALSGQMLFSYNKAAGRAGVLFKPSKTRELL